MTNVQFCIILLNIWLVGMNVSQNNTGTLSIFTLAWLIILIISWVLQK
jgi:hypothetical protein